MFRAAFFGLAVAGCGKHSRVADYRYTKYFENEVLRKRPYLKREWCILVIESPLRREVQADDRIRFWGRLPEFENHVLRVVTLADGVTIHNAFPGPSFEE